MDAEQVATDHGVATSDPDFADETMPAPIDWQQSSTSLSGDGAPGQAPNDPYATDNGFQAAFDAIAAQEDAPTDSASGPGVPEAPESEGPPEGEADRQPSSEEDGTTATSDASSDEGADTDETKAQEGEAADTDEPQESPKEAAVFDYETLSAELGTHVKTPEELLSHVQQLQDTADGLQGLHELVGSNDQFKALVTAFLEKQDPAQAALAAIPNLKQEAPDPDLDPEAYADYKTQQALKAQQTETQQKETARQKALAEKAQQSTRRAFQAFSERVAKTNEDFDAKEFASAFDSLTRPNPETGRFQKDAFDVVYRGLHHDELVAAAVEKARKDAFAEGARKVTSTQKNLKAPPNLNGSRQGADSLTDREQEQLGELQDLGRLVQTTNYWEQ